MRWFRRHRPARVLTPERERMSRVEWTLDGELNGHSLAETVSYVSRCMDDADGRASTARGRRPQVGVW